MKLHMKNKKLQMQKMKLHMKNKKLQMQKMKLHMKDMKLHMKNNTILGRPFLVCFFGSVWTNSATYGLNIKPKCVLMSLLMKIV